MGDEILDHKDLFSFHKKDIVADSSLAPHAKSFADMVLNKKIMIIPLPSTSSIPQQNGAYVLVKARLDSILKISSWRLVSLGKRYFLILLTS
ncbi:hypothetical protein PanWU01x14_032490 [Parasponia andersonii]|uniref:Uncharacterized protein n=1 Tax=Parasponia andersonii TaxID=3476 RepID=A0A2P5DUJ7_PARAD|nr:hypothetical protein PanWU01x14_032490 [Parasponia andersonii]